MTGPAIPRVSPSHDGPCRPSDPRPRRALAGMGERCPDTGELACRWNVATPELSPVQGAARERGQPPSRLPLAA